MMKNERCRKSRRRQIQQDYLELQNFEGYFRDGEFKLWFDYTDPYAYQCFGTAPCCSCFRFFLLYDGTGGLAEIHISYFDGYEIRSVCPRWYFFKDELMELSELPICLGFDEEDCDMRWNAVLRRQFRRNHPRFYSVDEVD